ncbi:MAG: hypothetical protein WCF06_12845 [Nitrososphaeraceae archaeon]|jgi:hypothetical protein
MADREGPTILWSMLKGKKVKSNDGKDVGDIKEVAQNFLRLEKGTVKKDKFWIPKYVADAYDGKTLWLLIDEGEILSKYRNGSESAPAGEQYVSEFEAFKKTPYGQKAAYGPDSDQNVRVVEDYKNVRDLK